MAARKKPLHPLRIEEMRDKIRATLLIKRLENHVFAKPSDENVVDAAMADSQVRAALGLLGKVLPNVSENNNTHSGSVRMELIAPWITQQIQARNSE